MDLTTTYLGLTLAHPFMPGASPLVDDLDMVRRLEDAGAAAIVMHSLFEEQITREQRRHDARTSTRTPSAIAEALSYFPEPEEFALGPDAVPGAHPAHQGRGGGAGHRLAQRHHPRRLARIRAADRAGRRRRPRAQRLRRCATDPTRAASCSSAARSRCSGRSRAASTIPVAVKLSPFYSVARPLRAAPGRRTAWTAWCCSTASTSPTSTSSSPGRQADAAAVGLLGAAAAAALAGDPVRPPARLAGRERRRAHRRPTRSRPSWRAPTRCRWSRRCCRQGPERLRVAAR